MNTILKAFLFTAVITLFSCRTEQKKIATEAPGKAEVDIEKNKPSKAEVLVAETIEAHGGDRYDTANYGFTFRDKAYAFENTNNGYRYTRNEVKNTATITDILENGKLSRTINGGDVALSEKDIAIHTGALNSVIYFATLPHKLKDKAVNKTYAGRATVKGRDYELLRIDFEKVGGGKDYDDKFLYWINPDTKTVDYLAYSYSTNNGGVRFRSAFNPKTVSGIRFQDYINYEVPVGTPLKDISNLYAAGELKELSRILTENVHKIE